MPQAENNFQFLVGKITKTVWGLLLAALVVILLIAGTIAYLTHDNHLSVDSQGQLRITPTQIQSIRDIGQWEFLSVSDEELIDTVRHGFFGDDELVRIYYGTLRIGIDLHETKKGWIRHEGDTIRVVLPPVRLLDDDFIDEARTRSFFESGTWTAADREAMYQRAKRAMKQRCLTEANYKSARQNAAAQMRQLLQSMGFGTVAVRFAKSK